MREEIIECLQDPNAVVAVEWADIVEDVLPPHRLVVRFQTMGEEDRQITFEYPPELAYLLKNNT